MQHSLSLCDVEYFNSPKVHDIILSDLYTSLLAATSLLLIKVTNVFQLEQSCHTKMSTKSINIH